MLKIRLFGENYNLLTRKELKRISIYPNRIITYKSDEHRDKKWQKIICLYTFRVIDSKMHHYA